MRLNRCAFILAIAFSVTAGMAAEMLDQSLVFPPAPSSVSLHSVDVQSDVAQTLRVGVAGRLTRIDLEIARYQNTTLPLLIDVRSVQGGAPVNLDSPLLASISLAPTSVPKAVMSFPYTGTFTSLDLSAFDIPVSVGDELAIVLQSAEPHVTLQRGYLWHMSDQFLDPYANGALFERTTANWVERFDDVDAAFCTYVATPEPSTALVGLMLVIGSASRPRR